jgi:hypothetical protein
VNEPTLLVRKDHQEATMRKFLIMIIALATLSFLAGVASAGTIQIGGTHSPEEIKATCDKAGGTYTSYGTLYGCFTSCGAASPIARYPASAANAWVLVPHAVNVVLRVVAAGLSKRF